MTRDQIIALVNQRAGNRSDLAAPCLTELPLIQEQVLEGHEWLPWFCEVELAAPDNVLAAGADTLPLPADYLLDKEDSHIWLIRADGSKKRLLKYTQDKMRQTYVEEGEPAAYCMQAGKIEFRPKDVNNGYTLAWVYYGKQADIASTVGETPWTKHAADVVLNELGAVVAGLYAQNAELAVAFKTAAGLAWQRLEMKHIARDEMNRDSALGG